MQQRKVDLGAVGVRRGGGERWNGSGRRKLTPASIG
jgi:hypothetical protein